MVTFKVSYLKSVTSFNAGKEVSCNDYKKRGYWYGKDRIQKTKNKMYLVVFGSMTYGNSQGCCDHVFEILPGHENINIEGLELLDMPDCEKGIISEVNYLTKEEWNEFMKKEFN